MRSNKPIAVLISDIHFNLSTLPIASQALKAACEKAYELKVPLIIAGDLNDTKAIIRAEVANELIDIFREYLNYANEMDIRVYLLVGNHDKINEKGEDHSLRFLSPYVKLVSSTVEVFHSRAITLVPYHSDVEELKQTISEIDQTSIIIMHQGVKGAWMGDYVQDKTSIDPEILKDFVVFSGHYHKHQTVGTVTYIGSPYTITFGEANDGGKGFLILNEDGSYTREILNLRKHVILERTPETILDVDPNINKDDLVWIKVKGPYSELQKLNKKEIGMKLLGHSNFKLDRIPTDKVKLTEEVKNLSETEILDKVIDNTQESQEQKEYLKSLWRELV